MTHWTEANDLIDDRENESQGFVVRYAPGVLAFALSAALGAYIVYLRPLLHAPAAPAQVAKAPAEPFGGLVPIVPPPTFALPAKPVANPFGGLVVEGFGSSDKFTMVENAPLPPTPPADLRATDEPAPLPPRRPTELARPAAAMDSAPAVADLEPKPASTPGVFEKLFGGGAQPAKAPESTLAYAAPPPVSASGPAAAIAARGGGLGSPGGGFGGFLRGLNLSSSPTSRFGDHVAVYDISARLVYLPDGTTLEAHSGLGTARDDPNSVTERMRGPTPPATYALSPREELFHGVAALRLTPVDSNIYGRAGLLAHTYMLGPDGDSNGCVSFRDYDAFLRAFRSGQISKLVVVTRL
jgi:hypothetical protein